MKYRFDCLKCQSQYEYRYWPEFPWSCFNCQNDEDVVVTKILEDEDIYQMELKIEQDRMGRDL